MALDEIQRCVRLELRLDHHGRAQYLVERREEPDRAVVAGSAHQVDVRLGELENRDHLQHVGNINPVGPPRAFWISGRAGGVDHGRAEATTDCLELVAGLSQELVVDKPAPGNAVTDGHETDVTLDVR